MVGLELNTEKRKKEARKREVVAEVGVGTHEILNWEMMVCCVRSWIGVVAGKRVFQMLVRSCMSEVVLYLPIIVV